MLDQQKTQEFKEKLLQEKTKLEKELGDVANKEDDGDYEAKFEDFGRDEEDNAEEVEEYTAKIGITETLEKNLIDVNDALVRIENGTYILCLPHIVSSWHIHVDIACSKQCGCPGEQAH